MTQLHAGERANWMSESIHSPRGPSMYGINNPLMVCMLVVLMWSRLECDAGWLHLEYGQVALT